MSDATCTQGDKTGPDQTAQSGQDQAAQAQTTLTCHDLRDRRNLTIARLILALDASSKRLLEAATGESPFANDGELKMALALLKALPTLFESIRLIPPPDTGQPRIPLIPKCPICGQGPGAHWPDNCPKRPGAWTPGAFNGQ
jgi:hypothetical protein